MRPLEPQLLDRQVAFNLLAQVGALEEGGHARVERRVATELKQVLGIEGLKVSVSCSRRRYSSAIAWRSVYRPISRWMCRLYAALLAQQSAVELVETGDYPTVVGDAVGQDELYVGRLRAGLDDPAELNLWIASDNVRKGSALNAVQIGELLIKHYL